MALWDSGLWDAANWSEVAGQMAATESAVDTFAAEGDVIVTGTMAATESTVDTFSSEGTVQVTGYLAATDATDTFAAEGDVVVTGYMAAVESAVDTFSAEGDVVVPGYMAATESGVDTFASTGTVEVPGYMAAVETEIDAFAADGEVTPAPSPVPVGGYGDYADAHKKARKKRDDELKREKAEKARLRQIIAEAIDPSLRQADSVEVLAQDGQVQVVADGSAVSIPVPVEINLAEAQRIVAKALERARVASVRIINEAEMRRRQQVEMARIAKRRRDDEMILLME